MTAAVPAAPQPPDAGGGRSFEDMLADPDEQFDPRSELLASIAAYAAAPPASAGSQAPARPLTAPDVVAGLLADVAESRAQLTDAAPELAAAMAETRTVRDGYQELCREFSPSAQSGMSARVSLTVLNRHRVKARLPLLATTVIAATREDITLRYRRERDEAREQAEQMELERNEARQLLANHKRAAARVHEELSAQLAEVRRIACQCGKDAVFVWRELLACLEGING